MMIRRVRALLFGIVAVTLFASQPTFAQSDFLPPDASPIQRQFFDELGTAFLDYWNPRLNEYKRTIDGIMTPTDLNRLNEMRVRWSILMENVRAQADMEGIEQDGDEVELSIDGANEERFMELFEIWTGTMELASRYRSGLDNMSTYVFEDASEFGGELSTFVDEFSDRNYSALAADEKGSELLSERDKVKEKLSGLDELFAEENEDVKHIYGFVIEPVIMLFNGGDLKSMLPMQMGGVSSVDANVVAGLLPEGAVLNQSAPNPASTSTTITYTLSEASSGTTLRLFSSDGSVVKTIDLGSVRSGTNSYDLDVSDLTPGSYLYHLTVNSSAGEMVYSKVMQVVR